MSKQKAIPGSRSGSAVGRSYLDGEGLAPVVGLSDPGKGIDQRFAPSQEAQPGHRGHAVSGVALLEYPCPDASGWFPRSAAAACALLTP